MSDHSDLATSELCGRKKTVLVIEDDAAMAEFLEEYLEEEKAYRVCLAANANKAFKMAQALQPNLVVIDHLLPDMKGLAIYDQLQTMPGLKRIPVLFMSASTHPEEVSERRLPFLQKPFTLEELDAAIDGLCPEQDAG